MSGVAHKRTSGQEKSGRGNRGSMLRRAAGRALLENLETRMLLSAGDLDLTFGAGAGYIVLHQDAGDIPSLYDTTQRKYFNWDDRLVTSEGDLSIYDVAIDPGGKILTAGEQLGNHLYQVTYDLEIPNPDGEGTIKVKVVEGFDSDVFLSRFTYDGIQDYDLPRNNRDMRSTLGAYPAPNWASLRDVGRTVAVDPTDGSILVAGVNNFDGVPGCTMLLARYYPASGLASQLISMQSGPFLWSVNAMAVQPDGKILVAGSVGEGLTGDNFSIWRFNSNLELDTTFGNGGQVVTRFTSYSDDQIMAMALEPQTITDANGNEVANPNAGKIVVVGYSDDRTWSATGYEKLIVARYNADGSLDSGFNGGGRFAIEDFGGRDARATAVKIQRDGKILLLGVYDANDAVDSDQGGAYDSTVLIRLNGDGTVDQNTFGARGKLFFSAGADSSWIGQALELESTGKILVGGFVFDGASEAVISRITVDGRLDPTYADNGIQILSDLGDNVATDWYHRVRLAVQQDDKAILTANLGITRLVGYSSDDPDALLEVDSFEGVMVRLQTDNRAPNASLLTSDVVISTPGTATFEFLVSYRDDGFIDRLTLDGSEISVTGPNGLLIDGVQLLEIGTDAAAPLDGLGNSSRFTVRYSLTVPEDWWADGTNNGAYTINLDSGVVADTVGLSSEGRALGQFSVRIVTLDTQPPSATLQDVPADQASGNLGIIVGGRSTLTFTVVYEDADNQVMRTLLGNGDLLVTGPNFFSQVATFVSADTAGNSSRIVATYRINAPGGQWDVTDNGIYTVSMRAGQVADTYTVPNYIAAGRITNGNFNVAVVPGRDVLPTAEVSELDPITYQQGAITFEVTYRTSYFVGSSVRLDPSSFDDDDLIRLVNGTTTYFATYAGLVSHTSPDGGSPDTYVVRYEVVPDSGQWTTDENGLYEVYVAGARVHDTDTPYNYLQGGSLGRLEVSIEPGPTAELGTVTNVTEVSVAPLQFNVVFSHQTGVDYASIAEAIEVLTPDGQTVLATLVSADPEADSTIITAVYELAAPGGKWGRDDNGTYTIRLNDTAEDINDPAGKSKVTELGEFAVNIAAAGGPTVTLISEFAPITSVKNAIWFTVRFSDPLGVSVDSIVDNDNAFRLIGPDGTGYPVEFYQIVRPTPAADDQNVFVQYRVAGPGGMWDGRDNGTYTLRVRSNEISDTDETPNYAPWNGSFATFNVAFVSGPGTGAGTLVPVSTVTTPETSLTFRVTFTDSIPLDVDSIIGNNSAIRVTSGNGYNQLATFVSIDQATDGSPRTATYQITARNGAWDSSDWGTYTVSLEADQVVNTSSGYAAAATVGTFEVNVSSVDLSADGVLSVVGTDSADEISLVQSGNVLMVRVNGYDHQLDMLSGYGTSITPIKVIRVFGLGEDDAIDASNVFYPVTLNGGAGNDTLSGGAAGDSLVGGAGNDSLSGNGGADILLGKAGNDLIYGHGGADVLNGGGGNDTLYGNAGNDTLTGGAGLDVAYGGTGSDLFLTRDSAADVVNGGAGTNRLQADAGLDTWSNIAELLA